MCKEYTQKSESLYARLFSRFYDRVLNSSEKKFLGKHRSLLLKDLKGQILEVGCGTGINFSFYPRGAQVVAIEPSISMLDQARDKSLESDAKINVQLAGIHDVQADKQFDHIVCTLVLCTVPEPLLALKKIGRLLKPGGRLIVLEHIRSHNIFAAFLQRLFRFPWKIIGQGCILNRDTDKMLSSQEDLVEINSVYFSSFLPFYRSVFEKK